MNLSPHDVSRCAQQISTRNAPCPFTVALPRLGVDHNVWEVATWAHRGSKERMETHDEATVWLTCRDDRRLFDFEAPVVEAGTGPSSLQRVDAA